MTELSHKTLHVGVGYPMESFVVGSSTVSYSIPADAFGSKTDNMDLHVYALADASTLASILPSNQDYILPTIITWLAADGTVPSAVSPLTQTILSSQIHVGTTAYAVTGTSYTVIGVATVEGSITLSITDDPLIVLGNPVASRVPDRQVRIDPPVVSPEPPVVTPDPPVIVPGPSSKITIVKLPVKLSSKVKVVSLLISPKTKTAATTPKKITTITLTGLSTRLGVRATIVGSRGQVLSLTPIKRVGNKVILPAIKFLISGLNKITIQIGKSKRTVKLVVK